jgi:predicted esterase
MVHRLRLLAYSFGLALLEVFAAQGGTPVLVQQGFPTTKVDGYWLQTPYTGTPTHTYPLIVWLHGAGASLQAIRYDGPAGKQYARDRFILVNVHNAKGGEPDYVALNAIIDSMIQYKSADSNRVYMAGFSLGCAGAFGYSSRFASRIGAIIGLSGTPTFIANGDYTPFVNLGVWLGFCTGDQVISVTNGDNFQKKIEAAGGSVFRTMTDAHPNDTNYLHTLHIYSKFIGGDHGAAINLTLDSSQVYKCGTAIAAPLRVTSKQAISAHQERGTPYFDLRGRLYAAPRAFFAISQNKRTSKPLAVIGK